MIHPSELINSQPVSTSLVPALINNNVLSITPLEIDLNHLQEWKLDGQEDKLSILKQIAHEVIKVLLCSMTAGIVMLSCSLAIEALIKGQQFLPTMLELTNSVSSFLGIASTTLLAVAFVPMVALTIFSIFSKSPIHTQDNIERVSSQYVEVVRVVVRSNGEERNPKSKVKAVTKNVGDKNHHKNDWVGDSTNPFSTFFQEAGNCSNQQTNHTHQKVNDNDSLNPFSANYNPGNCTTTLQQLTITIHPFGKVLC